MVSMRSTSVLGAIALLALGSAGCVATRPAGHAGPAALSESALAMVLRTKTHQENQQVLHRAEEELTRRCMARQGFGYAITTHAPGNDSEWRPNLTARRALGYGLGSVGAPADGRSPDARTSAREAASDQALLGDPTRRVTLSLPSGQRFTVPTTGCIAESRARLFGTALDAGRVFYLPQDAYVTLYDRIVADPAMEAATRRWAACMARRGHRYTTPGLARDAVAAAYRVQGRTGAAQEFDRRVAVADGECTLDARRPQTFDQIGRRHAARLPDGQRRELNSVAGLQDAALRYARDVTG